MRKGLEDVSSQEAQAQFDQEEDVESLEEERMMPDVSPEVVEVAQAELVEASQSPGLSQEVTDAIDLATEMQDD